jgi:ABC-2 type transport system permease protein
MLFIIFWMMMAVGGGLIALTQIDPAALAQAGTAARAPSAVLAVAPATGWPFFIGIGFLYFILSFLLLGAIFLGVGAQASTVREIQMLSLPITIFQVAMFSLSTAAANAPGSGLATIAQIIPFSSPLAMAARAATDDARAVHLLALGWQAIWVALVIFVSVRLFRSGVLSGRSDWRFWKRGAGAATAVAAAADMATRR